MTDLFQRVWLREDTYIDNLSPGQRRQLRALCERFFEKGRKYERGKSGVLSSSPNQSCTGESDAAGCTS